MQRRPPRALPAPLLSVLARYPQISETFVEGELRELVARGVPVEVVALAPDIPIPSGRPLPPWTTPRTIPHVSAWAPR